MTTAKKKLESPEGAVGVTVAYRYFEPGYRGGGTIRSITRMVDTATAPLQVHVITTDRDLNVSSPYPDLTGRTVARGHHSVTYLDSGNARLALRVVKAVRKSRPRILQINELWDPSFGLLLILATAVGLVRPEVLLISPRGSFSPGALAIKSRRKHFAAKALNPALRLIASRSQVLFHASATQEASDVTTIFPWVDTFIAEDQVTLPARAALPQSTSDGPLRSVFISRIAVKKNLISIIAAFARTEEASTLDIWGPLEDVQYWSRCTDLIAELDLGSRVVYRGELKPEQVVETFSGYDLFLFPTHGENFGHVIAESLAASCPVLCSSATPWTEILRNGGGLVCDTDREFSVALDEYSRMDARDRAGRRALAGKAYERWLSERVEANPLELVCEQLNPNGA